MQDTEFYARLLGLDTPWEVHEVKLRLEEGCVDIYVEHDEDSTWECPQCRCRCAVYDHAPERRWRHLDTCQLQTILRARIPRVRCEQHGVLQVAVPWAGAKSRFTLLMERFVIDVLKESATVSGACRLLGLSWDEVFGIMERAVKRGKLRRKRQKLTHVGVDEKAFKKGHHYVTVVCDLKRHCVLDVYEGRDTESLAQFWRPMTLKQRERIEGISMDMLASYYRATMAFVPNAQDKIVYDRFHIMRWVNLALDRVHRQEHKTLLREGNDILKGKRAMWWYAKENLPEKYHTSFTELKGSKLKVARAWALKESLRQLWDYRYVGSARKFFDRWYFWASHSRLQPMITVARMLKDRLENIITFCKQPITNGLAEGINSKIMAIKRRACGYRNMENFKTAIYFFCANLALYP